MDNLLGPQNPNDPFAPPPISGRELLFRTIAGALPPPGQLRVPNSAGGRILGTTGRLVTSFADAIADSLEAQRLDPERRKALLRERGLEAAATIPGKTVVPQQQVSPLAPLASVPVPKDISKGRFEQGGLTIPAITTPQKFYSFADFIAALPEGKKADVLNAIGAGLPEKVFIRPAPQAFNLSPGQQRFTQEPGQAPVLAAAIPPTAPNLMQVDRGNVKELRDPKSGNLVATLPVGRAPQGLQYKVANGYLVSIDPNANRIVGTVKLPEEPSIPVNINPSISPETPEGKRRQQLLEDRLARISDETARILADPSTSDTQKDAVTKRLNDAADNTRLELGQLLQGSTVRPRSAGVDREGAAQSLGYPSFFDAPPEVRQQIDKQIAESNIGTQADLGLATIVAGRPVRSLAELTPDQAEDFRLFKGSQPQLRQEIQALMLEKQNKGEPVRVADVYYDALQNLKAPQNERLRLAKERSARQERSLQLSKTRFDALERNRNRVPPTDAKFLADTEATLQQLAVVNNAFKRTDAYRTGGFNNIFHAALATNATARALGSLSDIETGGFSGAEKDFATAYNGLVGRLRKFSGDPRFSDQDAVRAINAIGTALQGRTFSRQLEALQEQILRDRITLTQTLDSMGFTIPQQVLQGPSYQEIEKQVQEQMKQYRLPSPLPKATDVELPPE